MSGFALTTNTFNFTSTTTIPGTGYDLSEFDGDSRGTARLADWSDLKDMTADQFDSMVEDLSLGSQWRDVVGYISWEDSTFLDNGESGNKYYRDPTSGSNVAYSLYLMNAFGFLPVMPKHDDVTITGGTGYKYIHLSHHTGARKLLVTFGSSGTASAIGDPHIKTFDGTKYTL